VLHRTRGVRASHVQDARQRARAPDKWSREAAELQSDGRGAVEHHYAAAARTERRTQAEQADVREARASSTASFTLQPFELLAYVEALSRGYEAKRRQSSTSSPISALASHVYVHACQQRWSQNRSARAQICSATQLFLLAVRAVGVADGWRTRCCHCAPSVAAAAPSTRRRQPCLDVDGASCAVDTGPQHGGVT
jgi:hypothetical protein